MGTCTLDFPRDGPRFYFGFGVSKRQLGANDHPGPTAGTAKSRNQSHRRTVLNAIDYEIAVLLVSGSSGGILQYSTVSMCGDLPAAMNERSE